MKSWNAFPKAEMPTVRQPATNQNPEYYDYLVTEDSVDYVVDILDKNDVFAKPYTEYRDGRNTIVGLRIGERPNHVVAFWGDTARVYTRNRRIAVMRLTEVRPLPEMTWHTVSPDEMEAREHLSREMEQAQARATCNCKERKGDDYTLSIDCGSIEIKHTVCGKSPWFMFNDFTECISMSPQSIVLDEATECGAYPCYGGGSCDCGPEIHLKTPEGKW